MSDTRSRRVVTHTLKIKNTSDMVQTVPYNSVPYTFQPGEIKDIRGQMDVVRDEWGRPTEEAMERRQMAPNKNATADLVADHLVQKGRVKGLCQILGDYTDAAEEAEARKAWIKDITVKDKAVEARWRQKCLESKAAGAGIPPMPANVEAAQDRLIKYRNVLVEAHKRFVITVDGRSFDTKKEAKDHIKNRYPSELASWETLVQDTLGAPSDEEKAAEEKNALDALAELAAKKAKKNTEVA